MVAGHSRKLSGATVLWGDLPNRPHGVGSHAHGESGASVLEPVGGEEDIAGQRKPRESDAAGVAAAAVVETGKDKAREGLEEALAELKAHEKTRVDVPMHRFAHTFADVTLERAYRGFFAATFIARTTQMWAIWGLVAVAIIVRAHAFGIKSVPHVVLAYAVLSLSGLGVWVLRKWSAMPRLLRRSVGLDCFVSGLSVTAVVFAFVAVAYDHRAYERACEAHDTQCLVDASYSFGFLAGLFIASFGLFFVGTIASFFHTFFLISSLVLSFLVIFIAIAGRSLHSTSLLALVGVYFALLLVHRQNDRFLRCQFLWFRDTVRLTQEHLGRLDRAKALRQRVVGYLFHEVRNPINDIVLAAALATDALLALRSPASPRPLQPPNNGNDNGDSKSSTPPSSGAEEGDKDKQGDPPHDKATNGNGGKSEEGNSNAQSSPHSSLQQQAPDLVEMLAVINHSAQAASRVLDDALDLQKLEAGSFVFVCNPFELRGLCEPVARALRPRFDAKAVELAIDVDPQLGGVWVEGDQKRLRQVVHNFLTNALKFTPERGRVVVSVQSLASSDEVVHVRVAVSDTGTGIRPEDQPKMFRAYSQIRAAETQAGGGTGLGLALSKDFVESGHHGHIGCASPGDLGTGSTFFFTIPFPIRPHSPPNKQPRRLSSSASNAMCVLLIVDDSAVTRRLMGKVLRGMGVAFEECENGEQAVARVREKKFKLVMMDKEMPVMDGYQATRAIRAFNTTVPIVGVTGNALDFQQQEFLACGANAVVSKPIGKEGIRGLLVEYGVLTE